MAHPIRILLVDDSPYFLEAARDFLDYQESLTVVDTATGEQDALAKSLAGNPDVILLDLNLAHRSGLELIPLFRTQLPDIKIIVLTMMQEESYRAAALQAGADAFVSKSAMSKSLVSTIMEIMGQETSSVDEVPAHGNLNQDEARFLRLAEHLPDLIYRYEFAPKRGFTYVSPSATALTGYTPEDHYADPDLGYKLVHPDDRHLFQAVAEGKADMSKTLVLRWVRKDGGILWTEQRNVNVFDDAGELVAIEGIARDITDRKRAEEDMRFQAMLVDNMHGAVVSTDAEFRIRSWNQSAERMFGYSAEEVIGRPSREAVVSEFVGITREAAIKQLLESGKWEGEVIITRKDGIKVHTSATSSVVKDTDGKVIGMLAINRDITARKQAEEKLRESEDRYRDLVENIHELICTHDLEGNLLSVNRAVTDMLGYAHKELIGKNLREFLAPEVRHHFKTYLSLVQKRGAAIGLMHVLTKSGEIRIWEYHNTLRTEGVEKPIVRGYAHDVTEKRRAEQALRASERRFRSLVENGSDEISILDAEGKLLYESPSARPTLGYQPGEYLGRSLFQLIHPDDLERVREQFARLVESPQLHPREQFRLLGRDGEWRWVEAVGSNLLADASVRGVVINYHDITERKRAEDEIQKVREFNQTLLDNMSEGIAVQNMDGYFIYANPATTRITGYSSGELLGAHWTKFFPEDQHEIIRKADDLRAAGRASQYELEFLHKNGGRIKLLVSGSPLFENGRVNGSMAVFTDITERKQAEEKLQTQFEELQRWYNATVGREERILQLKREINELLRKLNEPIRYPSAE